MRVLMGVAALASLGLGACGAPASFVDLGPISDADVLQVLRARTGRADPLWAELTITYVGPEATGTFEAVAFFAPPASLRVQAFKDLILTIEPIFDLVFTPYHYGMEVRGEGDDPPTIAHGVAADFVGEHEDLAMFYWVREAFCSPGALGTRDAVVLQNATDPTGVVVEGTLSSGAQVRWFADRATLEVTRAEVSTAGGVLVGQIDYADGYLPVGGTFVPRRAMYRDAQRRIEFVIEAVGFDPELDRSLLDPADVGMQAL